MSLSNKFKLGYIKAKFKFLSAISKSMAAQSAAMLFMTPQKRNKKNLPHIFTEAEKVKFSFEDYILQGYRWNTSSQKKILILHGFESSVVNFYEYVKPLINKGYQVLAFDAPAHGRSTGKTINVVVYINMVIKICNEFGPIKSFLAHSFGGLAVCLALENIKHDQETKLVLVAPVTETKTALYNFSTLLNLEKEVIEKVEMILKEIGHQDIEWYSISRAATNIKAQVLFLQDKIDPLTPYHDVKPIIERNYQNFSFIITEGLGHRRIYKDYNCFRTIIDFL